jgi:hypothetical protein
MGEAAMERLRVMLAVTHPQAKSLHPHFLSAILSLVDGIA